MAHRWEWKGYTSTKMIAIVYNRADPKFEPIEIDIVGKEWVGERKIIDGKLCIDINKPEGWNWVRSYIDKFGLGVTVAETPK